MEGEIGTGPWFGNAEALTPTLLVGNPAPVPSQGLWTPTILGGTTPGVTTYSYQRGSWIRFGKLVWVQFDVAHTAITGTGSVVLSGFPFKIFTKADSVTGASSFFAPCITNIASMLGQPCSWYNGGTGDGQYPLLFIVDNLISTLVVVGGPATRYAGNFIYDTRI